KNGHNGALRYSDKHVSFPLERFFRDENWGIISC
ncbi:MAG: hypothetical protein FD135_1475, partial [Comamonadaceae bacterium]